MASASSSLNCLLFTTTPLVQWRRPEPAQPQGILCVNTARCTSARHSLSLTSFALRGRTAPPSGEQGDQTLLRRGLLPGAAVMLAPGFPAPRGRVSIADTAVAAGWHHQLFPRGLRGQRGLYGDVVSAWDKGCACARRAPCSLRQVGREHRGCPTGPPRRAASAQPQGLDVLPAVLAQHPPRGVSCQEPH